MGIYYRLVCNKHKEVLDVNKAYELKNEIYEFIGDLDLFNLISNDGIIHLNDGLKSICKVYYIDRKLYTNMNTFIQNHKDCDLTFQPDEPHDDEIRNEDGWKWFDVFE